MEYKNITETLKTNISKASTLEESIQINAKYVKEVTGAERCSLFLYNKEKDQLKSVYADGINGTITLRSNAGIVGYAFHKGESVLENDPASSPVFLKAVDQKSHYTTKNILAVPIIDVNNKRLGVIQLLNKEEGFTDIDRESIEVFAKTTATILEPQVQISKKEEPAQSKEKSALETLQNKFDNYLADKKLHIMEDGSVYYKILNMKRDYFIPADKCYHLEDIPKKTEIYHYTITDNQFLFLDMLVKIDEKADALLIADRENQQNFVSYPLEGDSEEDA